MDRFYSGAIIGGWIAFAIFAIAVATSNGATTYLADRNVLMASR